MGKFERKLTTFTTPTHEHTAVFMCFPARSIDEEDHYIRGHKRNLKFMLSKRKKKGIKLYSEIR
jgi:hypothetical protein